MKLSFLVLISHVFLLLVLETVQGKDDGKEDTVDKHPGVRGAMERRELWVKDIPRMMTTRPTLRTPSQYPDIFFGGRRRRRRRRI